MAWQLIRLFDFKNESNTNNFTYTNSSKCNSVRLILVIRLDFPRAVRAHSAVQELYELICVCFFYSVFSDNPEVLSRHISRIHNYFLDFSRGFCMSVMLPLRNTFLSMLFFEVVFFIS